jgi:hypothetical protein
MLSTYVHMLLCLRAECTQCSPDSKQYKRVLGSALFQFALILVFRVPHTCVADSDAQGFARWLTCQAVFAKRKKAPAHGDVPGCVCKDKESTHTGRRNVAVVGGAMLGCLMWGYLGSMLTHVGLSLGHLGLY